MLRLDALRLCCLVGLGASAALLVDYLGPAATFCAETGCGAVKASGFGFWGPLPVPVVGLVAFGTVLALSLVPRARPSLRWFGALAALSGLSFIALQAFVIGEFCLYCLVADGAGVAVGVAAWAPAAGGAPFGSRLQHWAWGALAALAIAAPLGWAAWGARARTAPALAALSVPGRVSVVEFADFECPWCRSLHPTLLGVLGEYGKRVHFVRLNAPLQSHPDARGAAAAFVCAEGAGRGPAMADALFEAPSLARPALLTLARDQGLDVERFEACLDAPETARRIDQDLALLKELGFKGLPTTYIGGEGIVGAEPASVYRDAIDRALAGETRGVPKWLYGLLTALAVAVVVWAGRAPAGRAARSVRS